MEEQRLEFVRSWLKEDEDKSSLCKRYEISRPTGYKWVDRFVKYGKEELRDQSRAPHVQRQKTPSSTEQIILEVKQKWTRWGPKKVKAWLEEHHSEEYWPAASTIGEILKVHGLTQRRKYRKRVPARTQPFANCTVPNDTWCMDFKGWFYTGDKMKCTPFTLTDAESRYLLKCVHVDSGDEETVWPILEMAFREFGLPLTIRSDNGPPFASTAIGGLSRLAIKLIKANILPEWISLGNPQENGRHERMHLTLKQETASPPADTIRQQQVRFAEFIDHYNFERPHEGIDFQTPGKCYYPSSRMWTGHLTSPEYPDGYVVRKVRVRGEIKWRGYYLPLTPILHGEPVGLKEIDNDTWQVFYGPIELATVTPTGWIAFGQKRVRTFWRRYT